VLPSEHSFRAVTPETIMKLFPEVQDPKTIGNYEVLERIGKGGMGAVYKARRQDSSDGEVVALKLLTPDRDNAVRHSRFEQEYRAALRLDHPNIVKVLEFGTDRDHHFLVMEFVQGKSFGAVIEKLGRLEEQLIIDILVQVANALHQIHELKLVHRDVKPDNILVTSGGLAKLTDLGLVKILDDDIDLTRPNTGLGTPHFMAPEQFTNAKRADPRCDIYSLGATLYTAVTGEIPFRATTPLQVLKKKHNCDLPPVRSLVPNVSERIELTITRAMNLDPRRRHANCHEFIATLTGKATAKEAAWSRDTALPWVTPEPLRSFTGTEKRAYPRAVSRLEGRCLPVSGHREDEWSGCVRDISVYGIGLILNRRFEPGTILQIRLPEKAEGAPHYLLARVIHQKALSRRKWLVGARFATPLSEAELESFA
jgi:serine/threonine protein kinase